MFKLTYVNRESNNLKSPLPHGEGIEVRVRYNTNMRPRNPMPDDIKGLLAERGLMGAYRARPPYQQNDWLGWIGRAKRPETRQKRIDSMLADQERGRGYMGMKWEPS